jgi:hypothetical protein
MMLLRDFKRLLLLALTRLSLVSIMAMKKRQLKKIIDNLLPDPDYVSGFSQN